MAATFRKGKASRSARSVASPQPSTKAIGANGLEGFALHVDDLWVANS